MSTPSLHIEPSPYGAQRLWVGAASALLVRLSGSLEEQARQLGRLSGPACGDALRWRAGALERALAGLGAPLPLTLRTLIQPIAARGLIKGLDPRWRAAMAALADTSGVTPTTAELAQLAPELTLWARAAFHKLRGTHKPAPVPPELIGCTSLIARAPLADQLYHGRNIDLSDLTTWCDGMMIVFIEPDVGLPHVAVMSAGQLGAGLTAMNSAGLTLCVHHHLPAEVVTQHTSIGALTDHIMRGAHSIVQALDLARRHRPAATWALVMTEGDTGQAAVLEIGPTHERLWPLASDRAAMAYTHNAWDAKIAATLFDGEPGWRRAGLTRLRRARQLLFNSDTTIDAAKMIAILGDQQHPDSHTLRLGASAICGIQTAASVLFEPAKRRLWVGISEGSAAHGAFVPLSLEARGVDAQAHLMWPAPEHGVSAAGRAQAIWRAVWSAGETGRRAMIQIEHALALAPEEPDLQALAGLLAMRDGRGARAEGALRRALELEPDAERRAELGLMLGLAMQLHGLSGAAREQLMRVASSAQADPITRDAARQARWAMPTVEQLRAQRFDLLYATLRG